MSDKLVFPEGIPAQVSARKIGPVKGMIRPTDWSGISSGNAKVDALKEANTPDCMGFEEYDGEKWVPIK